MVLQGWEETTNLYADLFRKKDDIDLARARLASQKPAGKDLRQWFTLKRSAKLFFAPSRGQAGDIAEGAQVTVNRKTGRWRQLRLEVNDRAGKPLRRLKTNLWVEGDVLREIKSAFD